MGHSQVFPGAVRAGRTHWPVREMGLWVYLPDLEASGVCRGHRALALSSFPCLPTSIFLERPQLGRPPWTRGHSPELPRAVNMAAGPSPSQDLTSARHSFELSLSRQWVQCRSLCRRGVCRTVPTSSHHPQPSSPQAALGNPSPALAMWFSLPGAK